MCYCIITAVKWPIKRWQNKLTLCFRGKKKNTICYLISALLWNLKKQKIWSLKKSPYNVESTTKMQAFDENTEQMLGFVGLAINYDVSIFNIYCSKKKRKQCEEEVSNYENCVKK